MNTRDFVYWLKGVATALEEHDTLITREHWNSIKERLRVVKDDFELMPPGIC